jgi:hypothetical protein
MCRDPTPFSVSRSQETTCSKRELTIMKVSTIFLSLSRNIWNRSLNRFHPHPYQFIFHTTILPLETPLSNSRRIIEAWYGPGFLYYTASKVECFPTFQKTFQLSSLGLMALGEFLAAETLENLEYSTWPGPAGRRNIRSSRRGSLKTRIRTWADLIQKCFVPQLDVATAVGDTWRSRL